MIACSPASPRMRLRRARQRHTAAASSIPIHGHRSRVRLHHHRRRLGRLRARQPPERRSRRQGAAARSRPARLASLHPHARGPGQAGRPEAHQLGLRHRPEPQLDNRALWWPRGKVLGGSSSINAMCYVRGVARDYDDWAAQGAHGWDWNAVLPYFKRSEGNARGGDALHGGDGPLAVSDLRHVNPLSQAFIEAGAAGGLSRATTTSTARSSKASACTRSRRRTARAARPRSRTSTRCSRDPTSPSTPARWSARITFERVIEPSARQWRDLFDARQGLPPAGRARSHRCAAARSIRRSC